MKKFEERSPLALITVIIVTLGVLISYLNYSSNKKVNDKKPGFEQGIYNVKENTKDIILELSHDTLLPPDFINLFRSITFEDIITDIEYENLDVNVGFEFITEFKESFIKSEWYYEVGQYRMNSQIAEIVVRVLKRAIEEELKGYFETLEFSTDILGTADGIPMKENMIYKGKETIEDFRYYNINEQKWKNISLIPYETELDNEKLAFLRAYYSLIQIEKIKELKKHPIDIYVEEVDTLGDRKVVLGISIKLKDFFKDDLNVLERPVYKLLH